MQPRHCELNPVPEMVLNNEGVCGVVAHGHDSTAKPCARSGAAWHWARGCCMRGYRGDDGFQLDIVRCALLTRRLSVRNGIHLQKHVACARGQVSGTAHVCDTMQRHSRANDEVS
jgi:hypothetical protein